MSWIKRNLYFLTGSLVGLGLLGAAVVFLFGKMGDNSSVVEKLNGAYEELTRIRKLEPNPGDKNEGNATNKIDNVRIANAQIGQLTGFLAKARPAFVPVAPIPDSPRVTGQAFTAELLRTIDQMRREAKESGVALSATNYNFTFDSIVRKVTFSPASLQLLAKQLGEVRVLTAILFDAKINMLEGMRRVKVCTEDDPAVAPNDYHAQSPKTNDWAVLVPYEVTIRCFSSELAEVLAGLGNSPHCLVVKSLNIEPAPASVAGAEALATGAYTPGTPPQMYMPPPMQPFSRGGERGTDPRTDAMRRRYGPQMGQAPPPPVAYPGAPAAPAVRRGPQTVLSEQAVRVTLTLELVQLISDKAAVGGGGGGRPGGRGRNRP
jgi:hypothetical protein